MQPSQRSGRPPRLSRRNAIRQSGYVARAAQLSPSSDQPGVWDSREESGIEERDVVGVEDVVGDHVEAGRAEEAALVVEAASTSSASAVSVHTTMLIRRSIMNWRKVDLVGAGSSGRVYKAVAEDGFVFAVKEASLIGPDSYAKQSAGQLEQEIVLLSQLEHKNIVQYFGATKEETVLCIFLEFVSEGSLVSVYEKQQLDESTISSYTRQIINGLTYLHHHNVMHRDIKCANILVNQNGTVKVGDFGLAKEIKVWKQKRSCTGSVYWMAPEVVRGNPYGYSADIWSLGCTVLEMLTQRIPYPDDNWVSVFYQIGRGQLPPVPASLSPVARDFIHNCLQVNPDDRPSADELLNHPFVALPEPD
ncbi:hypothetical protein E2562_002625 [Oryza meyeriana var. granulata]|uniref:mitogen-activated protein kinase kinase kinase n=1 Tax=Oryza meyeriana var. granulata TaxID=110450 RepID=A0A6G1F2Z8_9ORYZ|nr:hypothetical protein E2562_002625 [Oryza meyeriana var. granulata]